jgi:transposase-like protein
VVLDILVQERRDQVAAETFLRRVLEVAGSEPRVVITDKLRSYIRPPCGGFCRRLTIGGTRD